MERLEPEKPWDKINEREPTNRFHCKKGIVSIAKKSGGPPVGIPLISLSS
jgi:hypothetical protein